MEKIINRRIMVGIAAIGFMAGVFSFPLLSETQVKGAYLGQNPPGAVPKIFAPGIISTQKGWEAAISFSADLSEIFYTSRPDSAGTENRIMHMKMIDGVWTPPKLAPFALDVVEYEAFIAPDDKKIFFKSQRPNPRNSKGGIWYSEREKEGWSSAKFLDGPLNEGWSMSVTSASNGTLYFTGNFSEGYGIYKSQLINGRYADPVFLPKEINKSKVFGASHPFIAPDEKFLIFDAGASGNSELYVSFNKGGGAWTEAVPFGKSINTNGYEGIASVSPDRKYLFFQRDNDIYWVSAEIIDELKKENKS